MTQLTVLLILISLVFATAVYLDFNVPDNSTLNPPTLLWTGESDRFFLIEDANALQETAEAFEANVAINSVTVSFRHLASDLTEVNPNWNEAVNAGRATGRFFPISDPSSSTSTKFTVTYSFTSNAVLRSLLLALEYSHDTTFSINVGFTRLVTVLIGYTKNGSQEETDPVDVIVEYTGTNDHRPSLSVQESSVVEYVDKARSVALPALSVADLDHESFLMQSATVWVSDANVYDELIFTGSLPSHIALQVDNQTVTFAFTGSATPAVYSALVSAFAYSNSAPDVGGLPFASRTVRYEVRDDNFGGTASTTVELVNINDPPVLGSGQLVNVTFNRDGSPVALLPVDVILVDPDDLSLAGANVSFVQSRFGDLLEIDLETRNVSESSISVVRVDNGDVRLTGIATIADYLNAIVSVTYSNSFVLLGSTIVEITVADLSGAVSDPLRIIVNTNTTGCFPLPCGQLPTFSHGDMWGGELTCRPTAFFACRSCYELIGPSNITCLDDGRWSEAPPTCELKSCGEPVPPQNGYAIAENRTCGSTATFFCDDSCYELRGDSMTTCQANKTWSGLVPTCQRLSCGDFPPVPENAMATGTGRFCDDVVEYSCAHGYALIGTSIRVCSPDGSWCGYPPVCERVTNMTVSTIDFDTKSPLIVERIRLFIVAVVQDNEENATQLYYDLEGATETSVRFLVPSDRRYIALVDAAGYSSSSLALFVKHGRDGHLEIGVRRQVSVLSQVIANTTTFTSAIDSEPFYRFTLLALSSVRSALVTTVVRLRSSIDGVPQLYGRLADGRRIYLDLLAAADFSLPLNESSSSEIRIELEINCNLANGDYSVFRFNSTEAIWRQMEAVAVVNRLGNDTCVWSYVARDFGWWAVASPWANQSCVSLSTTRRTSDVLTTRGVDFGFVGVESIGDDGAVCVELEVGGRAIVESGTIAFPVSASNAVGSCLGEDRWIEVTGSCTSENVIVADCGLLPHPRNGTRVSDETISVKSSESTSLAVVTFSCETNHRLLGSAERVCLLNGSWNGTQTTCELIVCDVPPIENGVFFPFREAATVGSSVDFVCDEGYTLSGPSSRTCQVNGQYDGVGANCSIVDCGNLPVPGNGSAVGNETTFNSVIVFECNVGFELVGSERRQCQANGNWSNSQPHCEDVRCPLLPPPRFGRKIVTVNSTAAWVLPQHTVTFRCDDCYHLVGSESRTCVNGEWTGNDTSCSLVDCGFLSAPANGLIEGNETVCPSQHRFACRRGYKIVGPEIRTCLPSGNWSGNSTKCELIDCGVLPFPENGSYKGNGTLLDGAVEFDCTFCYRLEGNRQRACKSDGFWTGSQPSCSLIVCDPPDSIENGNVSIHSTACGSSVRYQCNVGFRLEGSESRTCLSNGTWSDDNPVCRVVVCDSLPAPANGQKAKNGTLYDEITSFSCNPCFRLVGSAERQCQHDGTFDGSRTICERTFCDEAPAPSNGTVFGHSRFCDDTINFICDRGFILVGSSRRTCLQTGLWSGEETTCKIVDCGNLSTPISGYQEGALTTFGSAITFSCEPCCEIKHGSKQRVCQADGTWSGNQPRCSAIDACASNPCLNNGTCRDEEIGFTCFCPDNFIGDRCETAFSQGICGLPECLEFIDIAREAFDCGSSFYVQTFMKSFCLMSIDSTLSLETIEWARRVWPCLVRVVVRVMDSVYADRSARPTPSECQRADRLIFADHESCLADGLCDTSFDETDATALARVLNSSAAFRDRNVEQMRRLLSNCSSPVRNLDARLNRDGFRFVVHIGVTNLLEKSSAIDDVESILLTQVREIATLEQSNDTSIVVLLVNDSNAASAETLCETYGTNLASGVALVCPSCGDGVLDVPTEVCDDGNVVDGDGCASSCRAIEAGYDCDTTLGRTSVCYNATCGDGIRVAGEDCDAGGNANETGCLPDCSILSHFGCSSNEPYQASSCNDLLLQVNLGPGVGVASEIVFSEGQDAGTRVVSRPELVRILGDERDNVERVTVRVTADIESLLDENEYVYVLCRIPSGIEVSFDPTGKALTFVGQALPEVYESLIGQVLYFNAADEPRIFVNETSSVKIVRQIIVDVTSSNGLWSSTINVDTRTTNDHAPAFIVRSSDDGNSDCITLRSRVRRSITLSKKSEIYLKPEETALAPKVLHVDVRFIFSRGTLEAGSQIVVHFDCETNRLGLMGNVDRRRVLTLGPPEIDRLEVIAEWRDNRTLVILFPKTNHGILISMADISVNFIGGDCGSAACKQGVCHSSSDSCSIDGLFKAEAVLNY